MKRKQCPTYIEYSNAEIHVYIGNCLHKILAIVAKNSEAAITTATIYSASSTQRHRLSIELWKVIQRSEFGKQHVPLAINIAFLMKLPRSIIGILYIDIDIIRCTKAKKFSFWVGKTPKILFAIHSKSVCRKAHGDFVCFYFDVISCV